MGVEAFLVVFLEESLGASLGTSLGAWLGAFLGALLVVVLLMAIAALLPSCGATLLAMEAAAAGTAALPPGT